MTLLLQKELKQVLGCLALSVGLFASQSYAASFENKNLTADAAGVANAVTAGMGNISDALYNPASLAWQEGVQAFFSSQSRNRFVDVDVAGARSRGNISLGTRQTFAISWLPSGGQFGVAASFSNPYDTRSDWSDVFPDLGVMSIEMSRYSSDVFWRVNNTLGVAVGFDIYDTSLRIDTDGSSFSGSDWSDVGGHIGLRWEFMPFWTIGAHFRQGVTARASNNVGDNVVLDLPDEWSIGLSHNFADDEMLVELDVKQSTWSSFKGFNVANNGVNSQTNLANLKDTVDVMIGTTWFWRHDTQLRFGYAYEQGANQEAGYQPLVADLTSHRLTASFGGMMSTMHLDIALSTHFNSDLKATGSYAGTYSERGYDVMFSLSKKF